MLTAAVLIIVTLGVACVWQRRILWGHPEARAITSAIILMPMGVVLIFPAQEHYLGTWLHALTGVWYLNDYLSLLTLMIAVNYLVKFTALISPQITDEQARWEMRQVSRPSIVAALVMLWALASTKVARQPTWPGPIMDLPDGALWGMWGTYAVVQIWCLFFLLQLLRTLCKTAEHKEPLYWFMACAVTGIATECIVIIAQYTNSLFALRWYGTMTAILFALIGGLRSWRKPRSRPLNGEEA